MLFEALDTRTPVLVPEPWYYYVSGDGDISSDDDEEEKPGPVPSYISGPKSSVQPRAKGSRVSKSRQQQKQSSSVGVTTRSSSKRDSKTGGTPSGKFCNSNLFSSNICILKKYFIYSCRHPAAARSSRSS